MTRCLILAMAFAAALAAPAGAACYADYKAKKSNPLQLHYGVIELPDNACGSKQAAGQAIARRISSGGWDLLNVVSIFDKSGLNERKAGAGGYYLRF